AATSTHFLPHLVRSPLHLHLPCLQWKPDGQHFEPHLRDGGHLASASSATRKLASSAVVATPARRFSAPRREISPLARSRASVSRSPRELTPPPSHRHARESRARRLSQSPSNVPPPASVQGR